MYNYSMSEENDGKNFNHGKASVSDKIALVAELEHIRRHALRSASVSATDETSENAISYLMIAKNAQQIRRDVMKNHFSSISSKDWCLCKSAACLRQLAYEVAEMDYEELRDIDNLVDDIWSNALGEDLSDCESCLSDMGEDAK